MIRNLIFDFGNVFIDLDQEATVRTLMGYGVREIPDSLYEAALTYEKGLISTPAFVQTARELLPSLSEEELIRAWNAILLDLPEHRMAFLSSLSTSKAYKLFLLSNSNELHIEHLTKQWGSKQMKHFLSFFDGVYFSHEMGLRKPDPEIFLSLLNSEHLKPEESFFVDDTKENTDSATQLGLHTWHLKVGDEDISELQSHLP